MAAGKARNTSGESTPGMSEEKEGSSQPSTDYPQALSRIIHIGIPIASFIVLFAFFLVILQPPDRSTIPPESTTLFIPIYLTIVVVLVFGSMYLFKRVLDTETPTTAAH
jgi:hypothetical protein